MPQLHNLTFTDTKVGASCIRHYSYSTATEYFERYASDCLNVKEREGGRGGELLQAGRIKRTTKEYGKRRERGKDFFLFFYLLAIKNLRFFQLIC
jgi:hypothetical protein